MEQNRKERIEYLLAQRRAETTSTSRAYRENEIPYSRTRRLLQSLPDGYDTEDENSWGKGGLLPNPAEEEDYGETAGFYQSVLRKAARRLERWDKIRLPHGQEDLAPKKPEAKRQQDPEGKENDGAPAKKAPPKRVRKSRSKAAVAARKAEAEAAEAARAAAGVEKEQRSKPSSSRSKRSSGASKAPTNGHASSPAPRKRASGRKDADEEDEQLDDIDKELLGELSDDDDNAPSAAPAPKRESGGPPNGRLQAAAPAPYGDESSMIDGDGYASSSEREEHRVDEEMEDVDHSGFYDRNGNAASGHMSDDAEGGHGADEHHGDEVMLGA